MPKRFRTSASDLEAFFKCPASLGYSKQWTVLKVSQAIRDGLDAHAIMAGMEVKEPSSAAIKYAEKLKQAEATYRVVPIVRERKFVTPVGTDMELARRIDLIAAIDKDTVVIDYKTTGSINSWRDSKGILPKALSFQTAAYLLPEPAGPNNPVKKWPTTMIYMIVNPYTEVKMFGHQVEKSDIDNLKAAMLLVKLAKKLPKVKGDHCFDCWFFDVCYNKKGWEDKYKKRGDNGSKP